MQNPKGSNHKDELDMDNLVESELARLKRQYRIMEGDRKAFFEEMNTKLAKQRAIIQTLRNERNQLLTDLKVATSASKKRTTRALSAKINKMHCSYETYVEIIEKEKSDLKELNAQIRKIEKKIDQIRGNEVTESQFRTRLQSGKKSIELLENKLQTCIKRFCSVLSENKRLREEIDHLLKERANFNAIWQGLLGKLSDGKKFILYIIEEATLAYDTREEWCAKLHALKMRAKNDEILHTQDLREMQRIMDHDDKLKEFLSVKGQKRIMKDLEIKEQLRREEIMRNEQKQVEIYEITLKQIQDFCQEKDIDRIAAKYLKQDEENFALFNYVNELHHELECLNKELDELKLELEEQKTSSENDAKHKRSNIDMIDDSLEKIKVQAEEEEVGSKESEEKLQIIMDEVHELFNILDCDQVPILKLIGDNATINSNNIMIYLSLIEKRVSELLTLAFVTDASIFNDDEGLFLELENIS
ncbi:coiled-coil domain-containing protein 63 [Coccinella septempunctata]|uniref:coiled-coil domain-containing protein 63 n=1 Tax=Coccinella septempunctata TaxID=41139 RepID=UPI001D072CCB|nr:coiled-coil domain-containing protein 63 [Coccinella septempunctata]